MTQKLRSTIKTGFATVVLSLLTFTAVTYTSCTKDPCEGVYCRNFGSCVNGTCTCPTGYSGSSCDVIEAEKFLGNWHGVDCDGAGVEYPLTNGGGPKQINIAMKVASSGMCIKSIILRASTDGNKLTMDEQVFTDRCDVQFMVSGSGEISADKKTLTLKIHIHSTVVGDKDLCFTGTNEEL